PRAQPGPPRRARPPHSPVGGLVPGPPPPRAPAGDESPAAALARIAELTRRRRALIVLASDLFDPDDETLRALTQLRAQRHDVSVIHLLDPDERTFPYDGLTQFDALESAHKMLVNPAAIRQDYLERMEAFLAKV